MDAQNIHVSLGVWALKQSHETNKKPGTVHFASERARDLRLPGDFFSNGILFFSCYYPPLEGHAAKGKYGAFAGTESEGKEIQDWVINLVAHVERPDWDRTNFLPSWGGARFMTTVAPEIGAPNLVMLIVIWESGIGGAQCAQFCKRLEEAYIALGGYYTQPEDGGSKKIVSAPEASVVEHREAFSQRTRYVAHSTWGTQVQTEVPAGSSSVGRRVLMLIVPLCLITAGIWIWRQASASWSMGTLVIHVEAEHVRTPYYWLYLREAGKTNRIIASRGPSGSDSAWAQPIEASLPPGKYELEIYRSHPDIDAHSRCAVQRVGWSPNPTVTLGNETRVAFGLNAESEREWETFSGDCRSQAYAVPAGELINVVRRFSQDCEQTVARLVRGSVGPSSKIVLMGNPGFGYALAGASEFDALQVQHLAKAVYNGCWGWLRDHLASASAYERSVVSSIVEQSRANIDQLNHIADRLAASR